MICDKCNRYLDEKQFYLNKDRITRYPICKKCLLENIDISSKEDIYSILSIFDVPFMRDVWFQEYSTCLKREYEYNIQHLFGRYLRTMSMGTYCQYSFKDTERIEENIKRNCHSFIKVYTDW